MATDRHTGLGTNTWHRFFCLACLTLASLAAAGCDDRNGGSGKKDEAAIASQVESLTRNLEAERSRANAAEAGRNRYGEIINYVVAGGCIFVLVALVSGVAIGSKTSTDWQRQNSGNGTNSSASQ